MLVIGCDEEPVGPTEPDADGADTRPDAERGPSRASEEPDGYTFEDYKRDHVVRGAGEGWIVESDIPMASEEQVRDHFERFVAPKLPRYTDGPDSDPAVDDAAEDDGAETGSFQGQRRPQGSIVHEESGVATAFNVHRKLNLTYCFGWLGEGDPNWQPHRSYWTNEEIKAAVNSAFEEWERAADVNFIHLSQFDDTDGSCSDHGTCVVDPLPGASVFFRVSAACGNDGENPNPLNTSLTTFLGSENLFPGSPRALTFSRNSLAGEEPDPTGPDPEYFATILRHEAGHALALRHEMIRITQPPLGCGEMEPDNWQPLTAYDEASIMSYPGCNGVTGDEYRELSPYDRLGVAYLYNLPHSAYGSDYTPDASGFPLGHDIFWYRPGKTDYEVWLSQLDPTAPTIHFTRQSGCVQDLDGSCVGSPIKGRPFNVRHVDLRQDVFLYDPQPSVSYHFVNQGAGVFSTIPHLINEPRYAPIVGRFHLFDPPEGIQEDILWHHPVDAIFGALWHPVASNGWDVDFQGVPENTRAIVGRFDDHPFPGQDWDTLWYDPVSSSSNVFSWEDANHAFTPQTTAHCKLANGEYYIPLVGLFVSDEIGDQEIAWYAPYKSNKRLVIWDRVPCHNGGSYTFNDAPPGAKPVVGDFDFNGYTDILFYAQGPEATDPHQVWLFQPGEPPTPVVNSSLPPIGGDYSPFARDFNFDGCTDILWFAPHAAASPLWRADCAGGFIVEPAVAHPPEAYPVGFGYGYGDFYQALP